MSTPRRPAPRSSGAPITATSRCTCCTLTAARLTSRPGWTQPDGPAATPARVLLVDDDATFLEALRPLIEQQPALTVVGAAHDGLAAIELADALLPDAVVIDLHMPIVDGVAAVARLRKDHPSLCLLALTGDPDEELHSAVTEAGADAVVLKEDLVGSLLERLAAVRDSADPGRR